MGSSGRKLALVAVVLVLVAAIGGAVAFVFRDRLYVSYWRFVASRPLDDAEAGAITSCKDPGWKGLVRVLDQDVDLACTPLWFAQTTVAHLTPRRERWLHAQVGDPARPPRARRRAALALFVKGEPPVESLALLLSDPSVPHEERVAVIERIVDGPIPSWVDPGLAAELRLRHLADGDLTVATAVGDEMYLLAARERPEDAPEALKRVDAALGAAGLGNGRLESLLDRHAKGMSLGTVPRPLLLPIRERGDACRARSSPDCLRLAADLLAIATELEGDDGELHVADPPAAGVATVADPLWNLAYEGRPRALAAARARIADAARWVGEAGEAERDARVLGLLAHPRHAYGPDLARTGPVGDPLEALDFRRATPWATALATLAVGEAAGIPVRIWGIGDGAVIDVEGQRVGVGPCGAVMRVPDTLGPPWPPRAVLAQAAIEEAGGALRGHRPLQARRFAVLAERLDPLSAKGAVSVIDRLAPIADPATALGVAAGALAGPGTELQTGAEEARKKRSEAWEHAVAEWDAPGTGCPTPLGP